MWNFADQQNQDIMAPGKRKENCRFIGISRNATDKSMIFHFADETGAKLDHREFVPKRINEQQTDEEFKKNCSLEASRLAHITRAFVTEDEFLSIKVDDPTNLSKAADNFLAITKQLGGLLKKKLEDAKGAGLVCALKVTLRKTKDKYYSSFPQVPPFVSTTNHPKEFKWDPNYDILEAPLNTPDAEKSSQSQGGQQSAFAGMAGGSPGAGAQQNAADSGEDF